MVKNNSRSNAVAHPRQKTQLANILSHSPFLTLFKGQTDFNTPSPPRKSQTILPRLITSTKKMIRKSTKNGDNFVETLSVLCKKKHTILIETPKNNLDVRRFC